MTTVEPEPELGERPAPPAKRRIGAVAAVAIAVGVVVALLVVLLATREPGANRTTDSPLLGSLAPAIEGETVDGGRFDLDDLQGRFVLVNFFATWFVPCQAEHNDLLRFSAAHAEAGDARVVSVVFSDDADDVERFFAERGGTWPVIDDAAGRVALDFGVTGVPESFLVGPDGTVRAKVIGGVAYDGLEDLLRRASVSPAAAGG